MLCANPVTAWPDLRAGGRFVFKRVPGAELGAELLLPCGQCGACLRARAAEWALRCVHEAAKHEACCFVTLTYSDECFPWSDAEWRKQGIDFLKRLRKARAGSVVRSFGCRELGSRSLRPHFHFLVFGADLERGAAVSRGSSGSVSYESAELARLWRFGMSSVGDLTAQSAGYVARYVFDERAVPFGEVAYAGGSLIRYGDGAGRRGVVQLRPVVHPSGAVVQLAQCAPVGRSQGLGRAWCDAYGAASVEQGAVVLAGGVRVAVPAYYGRRIRKVDPLAGAEAAAAAEVVAVARRGEQSPERIAVRVEVEEARLRFLRRDGL